MKNQLISNLFFLTLASAQTLVFPLSSSTRHHPHTTMMTTTSVDTPLFSSATDTTPLHSSMDVGEVVTLPSLLKGPLWKVGRICSPWDSGLLCSAASTIFLGSQSHFFPLLHMETNSITPLVSAFLFRCSDILCHAFFYCFWLSFHTWVHKYT